jgi:hypothetical protein
VDVDGQQLVSAITRASAERLGLAEGQPVTDEVVAAAEPDGVRFEALGPVRLKGFTRPR